MIEEKIYTWKRYWHSEHKQAPLMDSGFLYVPNEFRDFLSQDRKDLATFEEISHHQCLALLGEPGMGKSQALRDAYNSLNQLVQPDHEILLFKLANYSDENRLAQKLFQGDKFRQWLTGSHSLHLFLDDLDEARLKIDTITHCLFEELSNVRTHLPRLFLRIACRTSDWPKEFAKQLSDLYGEDQVNIYKLAPLQIRDVEEAAKAQNINWDTFWSELCEKEIGPLAANPITLKLLLAQYHRNKGLPSTRREIYQKGCQALCVEEKDRHKQQDKLVDEQRFEIAARIAACMVFANRQSILIDEGFSDGTDSSLVLSDITDSPGDMNVESLPVYRDTGKETLETALFRGSTLKTWSHRTFAEFLGAWYATHRLDNQQIKDLLFLNGRVVPQLREVGAWLASFDDEIWSAIMEQDPELLLRSDISIDDDQLKAKWVEAILRKYAVSTVLDFATRWRYGKLKHRELAAQLRPLIEDKTQPVRVRTEAVEIAAACKEQSLQDSLVLIALNAGESMELREEAADALADIADSLAKAQLKHLALLPILDSATRKLKEYALKCVWPDHITTAELFDSIDLHYNQNYEYSPSNTQERDLWDVGTYLPDLLGKNSENLDLVTCLHWVQQQPQSHVLPPAYQEMIDIIVLSAWKQINNEKIADAFADTILSRINLYDSIIPGQIVQKSDFDDMISNDDRQRRKILQLMVMKVATQHHNSDQIIEPEAPFVVAKDIPWYIQEFNESNVPIIQSYWADFLKSLLRRGLNSEQIAHLYDACQACPELNQTLCQPFDAESLESEVAKKHRQSQAELVRRQFEMAARRVDVPLLDPSPVSRVLQYLAECEAGKHESWWQISCWMMYRADGSYDPYHVENANIENLPVWQELTNEQRGRIVQTAKNYILNFLPNDTEWLKEGKYNKSQVYYSIVAGCRAFHLLFAKERQIVSSLPSVTWQQWAATILYYSWSSYRHTTTDHNNLTIHRELLGYAYQHAPECVIASLLLIIELDNEYRVKSIVEWVESLWDDDLAGALVEKLKDKRLKPQIVYELLLYTIKHGNVPARHYAEFLVEQPLDVIEGKFSERAIQAARSLLNGASDAGWQAIWPSFQAHPDFGKQVLGWVISEHDYRLSRQPSVHEKLTEDQLVDLYIWLYQQFPPEKDWRWGGQVTHEDQFAKFRDSTLRILEQRGFKQALEAFQNLDRVLPHNESVRWHLANIQALLLRNTWNPPSPSQVIELAREYKLRQTQISQVNTGGGPYIAGDVNTGGGDFVGRDKKSGGSND